MELDCDVIVVGAGLSGLTCAHLLSEEGLKTIVLDAEARIGGRIHSVRDQTSGSYLADLGPTWVWPEYQPIAAEWLRRLEVETFAQYEEGDTVFDLEETGPPVRQRAPAQDGIRRIIGGPQALIDRLARRLPKDSVRLNNAVTAIEAVNGGMTVRAAETLTATHVIITAPLRAVAQSISLPGTLDSALLHNMAETPTWMAAQAKVVALYDRSFWREAGLSGRIASRVGPLAEAHDHSQPDGGQAAIFGFAGWPHEVRTKHPDEHHQAITAQLVRCFGDEAANHTSLHIEDWAQTPHICADLDRQRPPAHPEVISSLFRQPHCEGRLHFAAAETSLQSPGLIEGAFAAGSSTATRILASMNA